MKNTTLAVALLTLLTNAAAQVSDDTSAQEVLRQYTVEIIIFRYAQSVSAGTEVFPPDAPVLFDEFALDDTALLEAAAAPRDVKSTTGVQRKLEISRLSAANFTLGEPMQHLKRLDAYRPMMHFGWTQTMLAGSDVSPRPLSFFASPPAGLDGEITLYLGRYLHLDVDLQLDAASEGGAVIYRIDEDRIFRNGELRYFDHPRFGALAKITRVEEASE